MHGNTYRLPPVGLNVPTPPYPGQGIPNSRTWMNSGPNPMPYKHNQVSPIYRNPPAVRNQTGPVYRNQISPLPREPRTTTDTDLIPLLDESSPANRRSTSGKTGDSGTEANPFGLQQEDPSGNQVLPETSKRQVVPIRPGTRKFLGRNQAPSGIDYRLDSRTVRRSNFPSGSPSNNTFNGIR